MNMLLLVAAAGPKTVVDVGKEVSERALASGHEAWARVTSQVTDLVGHYIPNIVAANRAMRGYHENTGRNSSRHLRRS